jgi:hypothetical protein
MREARLLLNPEKMHIWRPTRQNVGLPSIAWRHRSKARQDKSYTGHDTPAVSRDMQKLIRRLAALNRFISRSIEQSIPFLKTISGTKDFAWGLEQAAAFEVVLYAQKIRAKVA